MSDNMIKNQIPYKSKNIYMPKELCILAENRAKSLYMNFSAYIKLLIVNDVEKEKSKIK